MLRGVPKNLKNENLVTCSPEMLDGVSTYDKRVDWWALGIILYKLMFSSYPFKKTNERDVLLKNISEREV